MDAVNHPSVVLNATHFCHQTDILLHILNKFATASGTLLSKNCAKSFDALSRRNDLCHCKLTHEGQSAWYGFFS